MTALFKLYSELLLDGRESAAWREAYAPDGDLGPLYAGDEAHFMAQLVVRVTDRAVQLRAACACAQRVASLLPPGDPRGPRTLAATMRLLDDPGASGPVRTAFDDVYMAEIDACASGFGAVSAVKTVYATAALALGEPWIGRTTREPAHLADVLLNTANALCNGEHRSRESVNQELAAIVRTHVPCPTLDALRKAFSDARDGDDRP